MNVRAAVVAFCVAVFVTGCAKPLSVPELIDRATASLAAGPSEFAAAEIDIKTVLQQEPNNATARYLYGRYYTLTMNPEAAAFQYQRSLEAEVDPRAQSELAKVSFQSLGAEKFLEAYQTGDFVLVSNTAALAAVIARAHAALGNYEEARTWLSTAVERLDDAKAAGKATAVDTTYVQLTQAVFKGSIDKEVSEAESMLEQLLEEQPDTSEAWSLLGRYAASDDRAERAAEMFAKATAINPYRMGDRLSFVKASIIAGNNEDARVELRKLKRALPKSPQINLLEGRLDFMDGDYEKAIQTLSGVLASLPDDPDALLLSGIANSRQKNYEIASRQLSKFVRLRPDNKQARLELARLRLETGEAEAAEEIAKTVLEEEEMNKPALGLLAMALSGQGQYAESAQTFEQIAALAPEVAEAQSAAGAQYLFAGDTERAIDQFREAVEASPEVEDNWARLVVALAQTDRRDEANEASEQFLEQHPQSPMALSLAGRLALRDGNNQSAQEYFERALEIDSGNSTANDGLATVLMLQQDIGGAKAALQRSLKANPEDVNTALGLASLEERTGNIDAMVSVLQDAVQASPGDLRPRVALARHYIGQRDFQAALEVTEQIKGLHGDKPLLHESLARAYVGANRIPEALESSDRLIELEPENAGYLALSARVQLAAGRPERAEQQLREALALSPGNARMSVLLVQALVAQNKRATAKEEIAGLTAELKESAQILNLRGRLALADRQNGEAVDLLTSALEKRPNTVNKVLLSVANWRNGDRDRAVADLETWVKESPQDLVLRNELARRALELGRDAQARSEYETILGQSPDNVLALNNLAWLLKDGDTERALELISRAEKIAPDSPDIADTAAMVYYEKGDVRRALRYNERALRGSPGNPSLRYHRAQILIADKQPGEALTILDEIASGPAFADQQNARELLSTLQ
ncbi:MAG: XrtA/PEP-CTERM system TPR-repeat protein PrsT [Pseudomonadota bacterium]